jgi:UDP-GlcNAc:undecaprenyl-phosphate/decaprenyl-phosphate GlcNAc-1-phosphate transferase
LGPDPLDYFSPALSGRINLDAMSWPTFNISDWSGPVTMVLGFMLATVIGIVIGPFCIRFARTVGAVDRPGGRKTHRGTIARLGGLIVFFSTWIAFGVLVKTGFLTILESRLADIGWVFMGGTAMLIVGAFDDKLDLPAKLKLLIQLSVAILVVWLGNFTFDKINIPGIGLIELGWLAMPITIVWVAGITNATNLVDGVDGLAGGVSLIIAASIALISVHQGEYLTGCLAACLAGGCLGFLRYNANPAKVFLGDSGTLFIGMTLAALSLKTSNKTVVAGSMMVPILLLGYPTLDTALVMLKRKLRGKPMFAGDRSHIHHKLLQMGLNPRQAVLVLYLFCGLFCVLALGLALGQPVMVVVGAVGLIGSLLLGYYRLGYRTAFSGQSLTTIRPLFKAAFNHFNASRRMLSQAKSRREAILALTSHAPMFNVKGLLIILPSAKGTRRRRSVWLRHPGASQLEHMPGGQPGTLFKQSDRVRSKQTRITVRVAWGDPSLPTEVVTEHRALFLQLCRQFESRMAKLTPVDTDEPRGEGPGQLNAAGQGAPGSGGAP